MADNYGGLEYQKSKCYELISGLPLKVRLIVSKALKASEEWHAGQTRGETDYPYITHLYHVVSILIKEMKVDDPEVLAAGALHDVVEDCGVSIEELERKFGKGVASIVESESENQFESRRSYMEHFGSVQDSTMLVKTADRIDNLRFVAHTGITAFNRSATSAGNQWPMAKVAKYVIETETYILRNAKRASSEGFRELRRLATSFKRKPGFVRAYEKVLASGNPNFED